jgi:uncharacterized repeat protein (TIGR01451 family)/uncharacterized repeat protein (TIGR02543 family)
VAALGLGLSSAESKAAVGPLTVTPITWNVVGLANNNGEVSSGPYEYPSGVRVCNTGADPATGISAAWTWVGGINAVSSNLWTTPADNTSQSIGTLAGGACQDVYFDLQIKQIQSNRDKAQQRAITVTSGNTGSASNTQYIYVESLVKQNRNSTEKLSGPGGCNITYTVCDPAVTNLYVGQTYTYKFYAQTATGYDELDAFALFPTFTQVMSTSTTYGTVTSPGPSSVSRIWSDACTWTGVTSSSSGTCVTAGKSGGRVVTAYTVKATAAGTGSVPDLIYDHSGSSFHYNADWSTSAPILASSFNVYYKLAATVAGNGTVTSNVAGAQPAGGTATINCGAGGTVCDAGYSSGNVTLTATPGPGQAFSGWSGDGSCAGASITCTVTMSQSRSVTATFTGITQYPLYVTKYGSGSVTADSGAVNCGATCSGAYADGTLVTLTAAAASGWSFTGWSGDCASSGTSPTCQVTMSQARNVAATFTQNTYTLTLNATGTGAGDLCSNNSNQTASGLCSPGAEPVFLSCGSSAATANFNDTTCTGTFPSGTSVTVYPMCNGGSAATPCPGGSGASTVSFGGYTGGTCSGNGTAGCTFTMDQNRTVNANFVLGSSAVPDLTLSKTHSGDFTQGGTGKTYSITVTNVGTGAGYTGKTITVTDSAPAGLTITAMGGTGWTCTVLPTCTQVLGSNLAAGAGLNPITVTVNVASNASTPLVNSATVACSSSCTDDATNDTATDSTNILTPSDLTLSKQHSGNFTQGTTGTYAISVSNTGGQPTSGTVTVTDPLPAGFTKSSFSGSGWDCSTSTASTLTCTRSDALAANASYPEITAVVNVAATAVTATNTATVGGGGETNTANDSSSDPTTVAAVLTVATAGNGSGNVVSDLGAVNCGSGGSTCTDSYDTAGGGTVVTLTETPDAGSNFTGWSGACAGASTTCQVTMSQARSVTATFTLQTFTLQITTAGAGTGTVTSDVGGISCNQNAGTCTHTYNYGTVVTLSESPGGGSSFAGWSGGCTVSGSNCLATMTQARSVGAQFDLGPQPDMTVAKSHVGNFTQGDTGDTYTITATNSGGAASSGTVTVTDSLPSGLSATAISGTGWSCTLGTLTCTRSDALAAAGSYPSITVTVNVSATAGSSVTNSATVSGGGESNTSNDTASDPTTVNQLADMTVVKSHTGNFTQGDTGDTYTITATNSGTGTTSGAVTVVDSLPSGLTATAISGGATWNCTLGTLTCTTSSALAPGDSYPSITVTVDVSATAGSLVTNTATVSGGGEVVTSNDSSSDPTTINQVADITIAKSHTGNFTQGDTGDTYTITATNSGTGATSGTVTVVDTLPSGLTATAIAGGATWNCTLATLTCTTSTVLAAGQSYPSITVTVDVSATASSSVTNSAAVSGGGEVVTSNDGVDDPTTIVQLPVLSIAKVHNPSGSWRQGDTGVASDYYTLTVSNGAASSVGPTSGTVAVTDTAPSGLTITAMSGTGWTCATLPACTRTDALARGDSYPAIKVSVDVAGDASATVTNGASVSGGTCASSPCDSTTDDTPITARYGLSAATDGNGSGTVTSDVGSINCGSGGSACADTYDDGTVVTLTATADTGSDFGGWSGACSGSASTCQVTMDQARSVTATFALQQRDLDVTTDGNGAGSVSSDVGGISCAENAGTCSDSYDYGTVVTLTATADTGSDFGGWSGACSGSASTCQVTMDQARSVTATFTLQKRDLDVSTDGSGAGSVSSDVGGISCAENAGTCSDSYDYGTVVTLTATADTGSDFIGWTGACSGSASTCEVTMDQARSVTATFTLQKRGLDVTTDGNGSGSVTSDLGGISCDENTGTCSDSYDYGTVVTLTATADTGSDFAGWSNDCSGTSTTCQVTLDQARKVTATFTLEKRDLSVATDGNGSGSVSSDVGGIDCTANTGTCGHSYDYGTDVTLTAAAATGSDFTGWTGDIGSCDASATTCQVTMDQARSVTATFTLEKRDLSVGTNGFGSGSVTTDIGGIDCTDNTGTCGHSYDYGTLVTLTASAATDSTFMGWSGDIGSCDTTSTTCAVTMDQARSIIANFGRAGLLVTKSHSGEFTQGDVGDEYTIAVKNTGDGPTTEDVTVTEEPPASLIVTAMTGTGWDCSVGTLTCTRSDALAPGDSYPDITVTVTVASDAPESATNSATADGGGCAASPCSTSDDPTTINANTDETASASGLVYHDLNANGAQDSGEPGLQDWQVWIDLDGNGHLDPGDPTAQTASDGSFSITGIEPGTYTVYETAPAGWICSQPNPCQYDQTFSAGQNVKGLDFGNYRPALVRGKMFDDLNRDGKQEAGEPGLDGWRIYVDYNDNGEWDPGEPFALTSATASVASRAAARALPGHYTITGIVPGDWPIREVRQNGYVCTLPFQCAYEQTFLEGSVIDNRDFATFRPELAGKATLQAPQACVRGNVVVIRVRGRQITRVVVSVAPGFRRSLRAKPSTHQTFAFHLKSSGLAVGAHRVTARVYFTRASATKSVLLRGVVYRCGSTSPPFTG